MTKKLFALYFRLIFSSPAVWAYYALFAGFMVFIICVINLGGGVENFYTLVHDLAYIEVIIACFAFCLALMFARKKSTLETACLVPAEKSSLVCALSVMLASWLVCLVPIIYSVVIVVVQNVSFEFCMRVIIYTCARWMVMLFFMVSMGFLIGRLVKSAFVYLLAAPAAILFSNFNESIFRILRIDQLAVEKVSTMLSIHHLYVGRQLVDYADPYFSLFFLSKMLAMVLFSGLLLYILFLVCKKRRSLLSYGGLAVIVVAFGLSAYFYTQLFPERYYSEDKLFVAAENDSGYNITAYSGDITLSEFSKFECAVTVEGDGSGEPLKLRLDEALKLDGISCGSEKISYVRDGDYLTIDAPLVSDSTNSELNFTYSGRINYIANGMGVVNIFSTYSFATLPPTFAFLPVIDGDKGMKNYDLNVKAGNTVVSNLDVEGTGRGEYSLKGESNLVCIFVGNFEETEIDGITFIRPKDYNSDFDADFELFRNRKYWELDSMTLMDEDAYAQPLKVFQIYFFHAIHNSLGFSAFFDDCLIIHHWAE